jgi:hypothetical protein
MTVTVTLLRHNIIRPADGQQIVKVSVAVISSGVASIGMAR